MCSVIGLTPNEDELDRSYLGIRERYRPEDGATISAECVAPLQNLDRTLLTKASTVLIVSSLFTALPAIPTGHGPGKEWRRPTSMSIGSRSSSRKSFPIVAFSVSGTTQDTCGMRQRETSPTVPRNSSMLCQTTDPTLAQMDDPLSSFATLLVVSSSRRQDWLPSFQRRAPSNFFLGTRQGNTGKPSLRRHQKFSPRHHLSRDPPWRFFGRPVRRNPRQHCQGLGPRIRYQAGPHSEGEFT